jgi:hypothetical protein
MHIAGMAAAGRPPPGVGERRQASGYRQAGIFPAAAFRRPPATALAAAPARPKVRPAARRRCVLGHLRAFFRPRRLSRGILYVWE